MAWCRLNKYPVLFMTLTYDLRRYGDLHDPSLPERLWEIARTNKDVSKFMGRLGEKLGKELTGLWRVKVEFTQRGMLHFHLLLRGFEYISWMDVEDAWGHGFVKVQKAKRKHASYMAKYQAKAGGYPQFLYDKSRRAVKVWGTSPGFWVGLRAYEAQEGTDGPTHDENDYLSRDWGAGATEAAAGRADRRLDITVGEAIRDAADTVIARTDRKGDGGVEVIEAKGLRMSTLAIALHYMGFKQEGTVYGWRVYDVLPSELKTIMLLARTSGHETTHSLDELERWYNPGPPAAGGFAAPAGAFNLNEYQDRGAQSGEDVGIEHYSETDGDRTVWIPEDEEPVPF
jgi:hypothetical protein